MRMTCTRQRWIRGVIFLLLCSAVSAADSLRVASRAAPAVLVELYTSEGCSSCPPADTWLGSLADHPQLWDGVVPVAFHVDYWNELGWKDPYASNVFSHRQRKLRDLWNGRYLYTPALAVNGREWFGWRQDTAALPVPGTNAVGVLSVALEDTALRVDFDPVQRWSGLYDVFIVLLGAGLTSDVSAGENAGRTLHHDFTVLRYNQFLLKQRQGKLFYEMKVAWPAAGNPYRRALAVWVTPNRSMVPLQAVGGWVDAPGALYGASRER